MHYCIIIFFFYSSWQGEGIKEVGLDKETGEVRVTVDPKYYRPSEVVSYKPSSAPYQINAQCHILLYIPSIYHHC